MEESTATDGDAAAPGTIRARALDLHRHGALIEAETLYRRILEVTEQGQHPGMAR